MALILLDGCEDFSALIPNVSTIAVAPGRYQKCIRCVGTQNVVYRPRAAQEADTITMGFAFRWAIPAGSNCTLVTVQSDSGATSHNSLILLPTGAIVFTRGSTTAQTSAASLVTPGVWHHLEVQFKLHDTLGTCTVLLNGATVLTFGPSDSKNAGTKTVYDTIWFPISSGHTVELDDLYICMAPTTPDPFLGDITVETLLPNGDAGGTGTFTPTGPEEHIVVQGAPGSDQAAREVGLTTSFNSVGIVTRLRYYRRAATPPLIDFRVWSYPSGSLLAGPVSHSSTVVGYDEVTLPTPLIVSPGTTLMCSMSCTSNTPESAFDIRPITPSANCVGGTNWYTNTLGAFPTTDHFSGIYIEPIFVPGTFGAATNEWIGSDGDSTNNYQLVDDVHPVSVNDYVYTNTVGAQDLYNLSDLAHTTGTVIGVCHSAQMIRTDAATPMGVKVVTRGAVENLSPSLPLGVSYRSYDYVLTTNPETSAPFTIPEVNALQTGVELAAYVPLDPSVGRELWLDSSDPSTFTYSSGVVVSQWADKSGNGRHFVQATPANQPSRSGTLNGLDAVVFDGVNDRLTCSSWAMTRPVTVFLVARNTAAPSTQRRVFTTATEGTVRLSTSGLVEMWQGSLLTTSDSWGTTTAHQITALFNSSSSKIIVDGGTPVSGDAGGTAFSAGGTSAIGSFTSSIELWQGEIAELIIYSREMFGTERTDIETYLQAKWGTP